MEEGRGSRPIVVGIDGSSSSERALRWAAREALDQGVGLDVVHAWTMPYSVYSYGGFVESAPFEHEASAVLARAVGSLAGFGSPRPAVRPFLVEDDAAAALVRAAEDAELLVVGSRGRGGFVGLLMGSVSQRCVVHAPCSVAVVRPGWVADGTARVVVGVDGSEASYGALHWAIAEAGRRGAHLDVVNAYESDRVALPVGATRVTGQADLEASSRALVEEMVAGALGRADRGPTRVELISTPSGAARGLLESAEGADLLVVGSRGRGTVRGLLLGSVSQQCVHHAPCPVVVTRPRLETQDNT